MTQKKFNQKYILAKKGNEEKSDLKLTYFTVNGSAIETVCSTPNVMHKALKVDHKLWKYLKNIGLGNQYQSGGVFHDFLTNPAKFKKINEDYQANSSYSLSSIAKGEINIILPKGLKDAGVDYIRKNNQG